MQANPLFLLEFVVFSGGALAWAAWEYLSVRPGKSADKDKPPSSGETRHPEREHRPDDR